MGLLQIYKKKKKSWYTWIKVLFPDSIKKTEEETLPGLHRFDRIASLIFMHKTQQLEEVFKLD